LQGDIVVVEVYVDIDVDIDGIARPAIIHQSHASRTQT
jgi:hypothetical protein